jgi:hypothetical protein
MQWREMRKIPVKLATGHEIRLSPGAHSELIKAIIEEFAPRFVPGCVLVYAGDTGEKWGYFDKKLLEDLGVRVDDHGNADEPDPTGSRTIDAGDGYCAGLVDELQPGPGWLSISRN